MYHFISCYNLILLRLFATCFEAFDTDILHFSRFEIENENLFVEISGIINAAISWEERAKLLLEHTAPMSEFEEVLRYITVSSCTHSALPSIFF